MDTSSMSLDIADIVAAIAEIDYAAEQAAYRGWQNIRQILALRDRLEAFAQAPAEQNINVTEIADAVKVIDYACEQGAYRGWEKIRQTLALRDRLETFAVAATAHVNTSDSVLEEAEAGAE
jgi:hypothetical protein